MLKPCPVVLLLAISAVSADWNGMCTCQYGIGGAPHADAEAYPLCKGPLGACSDSTGKCSFKCRPDDCKKDLGQGITDIVPVGGIVQSFITPDGKKWLASTGSVLVGFGRASQCSTRSHPLRRSAAASEDFRVKFDVDTTAGPQSFIIKVHRKWAPIGAARFMEAVQAGVYNDSRFFRVIPSFMVQFGIPGDPTVANKWRTSTIKDDAVTQSNKVGYVTFATSGPNSRTTQLFINYADNAMLDGQGFSPFGVVEGSGMEVVRKIYNCGERPDQGKIQSQGNRYLDTEFPKLSKIIKASVLGSPSTPPSKPPPPSPPTPPVPSTSPVESCAGACVHVRCGSTAGSMLIKVHKGWAPIGAQRFLDLVDAKFFDGGALFRAIPNFLVQFGISKDRLLNKNVSLTSTLQDDVNKGIKVKEGYMAFAGSGKNSRTTQMWIAFADSDTLGKQPWETPFGFVVSADFGAVHKISTKYGDMPEAGGHGPDPSKIKSLGYSYLSQFPDLTYFTTCRVVSGGDPAAAHPGGDPPAGTQAPIYVESHVQTGIVIAIVFVIGAAVAIVGWLVAVGHQSRRRHEVALRASAFGDDEEESVFDPKRKINPAPRLRDFED